jgi:hypothetical protein
LIELRELEAAVESAFGRTSRGLARWPDPHPDHSAVPDELYSRCTNPAKWRILAARADAWLIALVDARLATVVRDARVTWTSEPGPVISRSERAVPVAADALELVIAHSRIDDVDDAGLVLGIGNPAECVDRFPDCGCDACDSGSQNELDHLDSHLRSIVTGSFRRLRDGDRVITVVGDSWRATGFRAGPRRIGRQVEDVLADPHGWEELAGASWLAAPT